MRRLALVLCLALPFVVLAQDAAPPAAPELAGVPSLDQAPAQFALLVLQLAQGGRWGAAALLVLFGLVFGFRKLGLKLVPGKVGDFLRGKWGGWLINFALAVSGGFGSLLMVGTPITALAVISVLGGSVTFALGSAGLNELVKDLTHKPAEAAGDAAATNVAGMPKADLVSALEKGPPAE